MTLYEMLDCTKYYQTVWIFESNSRDQNMPLFKGSVHEARGDTDRVWGYLMCQVEHYDCTVGGILDIRVRDEYFEEPLEGHYSIGSRRWGEKKDERPWRYSIEIDQEKAEAALGGDGDGL
jgi:hypothetical protein